MKKIVVLIMVLALPLIARADSAAQISLSVSKNTVAVGDSFQVTVTLKNASTGGLNIGNISIPGLNNFDQRGSSQSTQIEMVNGATTAVTETVYTLVAKQAGTYKLGPVQVVLPGSASIASNEITVTVSNNNSGSDFSASNGSQTTGVSAPGSGSSNIDIGNWIVNGSAALLLAGLVYALYRRQQGGQASSQADESGTEPETDPAITLPDLSDTKFFEKAKAAVLAYAAERYGIDTEVLTSREIIEELAVKRASDREAIAKALTLCDQGSFASNKSGQEELVTLVNSLKY